MKTQPIKRREELKILSREHHFGLLFCWKIRTGIKLNVATARLRSYLDYFWENHLKDHFLNEEVLLFRLDEPVCNQAKADHQAIRNQIEHINAVENDNIDAFSVLTDMLVEHIRFEERIAFPVLEEKIPEPTLREISLFLEKDHAEEFKDDYKDEFWIKPKDG